MRLQITTVYPRFAVEYHWPRAEIRQEGTRGQGRTEGPVGEIDQRHRWADLVLDGPMDFAKQGRDEARFETVEAIGKIAAEGDEVAKRAGHNREDIIFADQARRSMDERIPELNVQAVPKAPPRIKFHYSMELDWSPGGAVFKHQVRPPSITWQFCGVFVDVRV